MTSSDDPGAADPDLDLPLLANADEIRVRHHFIKLRLEDFRSEIFEGDLILFLEIVRRDEKRNSAEPVLAR